MVVDQLFWLEKDLYIHERSNRFYSRSAYFVVKVRHSQLLSQSVTPVTVGHTHHDLYYIHERSYLKVRQNSQLLSQSGHRLIEVQ